MALDDLQTLHYRIDDGVATITLNRPEKMNAFNGQMRDELIAAFDASDADDTVRAVIVTGAGKAWPLRRRARRRDLLPGETPRRVHRPGIGRHAGFFSVVGRTAVRIIVVASSQPVTRRSR